MHNFLKIAIFYNEKVNDIDKSEEFGKFRKLKLIL